MNRVSAFIIFLFTSSSVFCLDFSPDTFTRQDSLRGSLNPYRSGYDVGYYDLNIEIFPEQRSIQGHNTIWINVLNDLYRIQLDLFENMEIDSIRLKDINLIYQREGNAIFIDFPETLKKGQVVYLSVFYHGKPRISERPPWDGGFVWELDSLNRGWHGVACEGTGASLWWPVKDHLTDEPDSMRISLTAPDHFMAISNGRLERKELLRNDRIRWDWYVSYPINNYNVTANLAHYTFFNDYHIHQGDSLLLSYYVLDYNLDRARPHFEQVKPMLDCFNHYLGEFPFHRDGFAMVETPYWGMEHQSCIAYGNNYENNDYGFDFIIVHESAHEYWGNSVTAGDHAELWIHESFATYMEALYVEYFSGKEKAIQYLQEQKEMIYNLKPVLGPLGVNYNEWVDADMYYKGSWMLHSVRNTIDSDSLWFTILKETYQRFKYSIVSTNDVVNYIDSRVDHDLKPVFEQYLTTINVPELKVKVRERRNGVVLKYKWTNVVKGFKMPVKIRTGPDQLITLYPELKNKKMLLENVEEGDLSFATDLFYFEVLE